MFESRQSLLTTYCHYSSEMSSQKTSSEESHFEPPCSTSHVDNLNIDIPIGDTTHKQVELQPENTRSNANNSVNTLLTRHLDSQQWRLQSIPGVTIMCHSHECNTCTQYTRHLLEVSNFYDVTSHDVKKAF